MSESTCPDSSSRLGNHRHRQYPKLARRLRDDRGRAGAGASAHAGGQEQHIGALNQLDDPFAILHRRFAADFGIGSGAQSLGYARTELQKRFRTCSLERLSIGIGADELHTFDALLNHVVNRISAATTNTEHLDDSFLRLCVDNFKHLQPPLL